MIRVADYIANFIVEKGVKDFFLLPGGGAMYLVDALGNHKDFNFIACHHEQSASIAAESYGRIKDNFGVGLVTTGPGSTNAITAVAGAWIESVPLMIISGQVKRSDLIGDRDIRQGGVQEVDIISSVKNYTKYAVTVDEPRKIKYYIEKAYLEMMSGRKGPVWIDVPLDVQASLVDNEELEIENEEWKNNEGLGIENEELEEKLSIINYQLSISKKPLILAGHGIRLSGAKKEFRKLIEKLNIPIVTTWNAMDLIEHSNKLFAGKAGVVAPRYGNFAIQNCDLLISIGSRLDNIITAYNPKRFAKNAKKIMIDIDKNEILNSEIDFELTICYDAKEFIKKLYEKSDSIKIDTNKWVNKCNYWKNRYSIEKEFDFSKNKKLSHYQFALTLSKNLKGGEIISTGSSGLGLEALYVAFEIKKDQRMFLTSGLGAMGYGLPSAIGACVANNRQKIIAIESDGSLQLNIQEFATIKGLNLPIMLFIMDNAGYASIRNTQRNYFDGRYVATGKEGNLHMPDIEKIVRAYEIDVDIIRTEDDIKKAVKEFDNLSKPKVFIVKLMENESLYPKSMAMPQSDGTMVSMPLEDMSPLLPLEELEKEMDFELEEVSYKVRQ